MKKRLLALLLTLVMLLSLSVTALAAETRETDFFDDLWHADVNFEDMEYVPVDTEAALAAMDATRTLVEDEANKDAVLEGFKAACELSTNARTMYTLANIRYSQDYASEENFKNMNESQQAAMIVGDALYGLARDILNSPCAAVLDGIVTEEDAEYLRDYENMTDEELAMQEEITALENEYQNAAFVEYSTVVDGVEWTDASCEEAYYAGDITYDEYIAISRAVAKEMNAVLGEIYLRIVDAHKREAVMEEYDNYADYAYENVYDRDYTPLEIRNFHDAVKQDIAPLDDVLYQIFYDLVDIDLYYGDFTGDIALDIMDPYIASLSSELYESFCYMRDHHLYDSDYSDTKDGSGFSTILSAYQAPYFFNTPTGTLYDLTTAVHEFGHYNNFYWTDGSWYDGSKGYDIDEVHSQGLELLFTEFYPEIFGESGDFVTVFILYNMVSAIVQGALHDELQQYAFETEGVTLQQINEKYCQLMREYGQITDDDERTEMYGWVEIHHTFDRPFYYISYATSAAGALEFWLEAQEDYFAGVDDYLRFTAQKMDEYGFQEGFEAIGLRSPVDPEYIASLGEELTIAAADYEAPSAADYFTDVTGDEPWYEAVASLYDNGVLNGVADGVLDADGAMTRAQASTVLCRLIGMTEAEGADYFTDVTEGHWYTAMVNAAYEFGLIQGFEDGTFRPGDTMSRQDFAVVLYNVFNMIGYSFDGAWAFDLGAADADEISDYALEAVSWGVMYEYITLDENSQLRPTDNLTRAEMAEMIYYAFLAE